jgi:hypothetical protein
MNIVIVSRLLGFLKLAATSSRNNALSLVGNTTTPTNSATLAEQVYRAGFIREFKSFSAGIDSTEYRASAEKHWQLRNDQDEYNQFELRRKLQGFETVRTATIADLNTPAIQRMRELEIDQTDDLLYKRLTDLYNHKPIKSTI